MVEGTKISAEGVDGAHRGGAEGQQQRCCDVAHTGEQELPRGIYSGKGGLSAMILKPVGKTDVRGERKDRGPRDGGR